MSVFTSLMMGLTRLLISRTFLSLHLVWRHCAIRLSTSVFESYKFIPADGGEWGLRQPDGSWSGMIGQLNRTEVDMALGPFALNHERFQAATFSKPFLFHEYLIMYPRPQLEPDLGGFYRPFTQLTWITIFLSLLLVSTCLCAVAILVRFLGTEVQGAKYFQGSRTFTWVYGVLLGISMRWSPSHGSILAMVWILVSLILSTVYKSNLKAMLILPKVNIPFNNLEELVNTNAMPYYVLQGMAVLQNLQDAPPNSVFGRAYRNVKVITNDVSAIADVVLDNKAAFFLDTLLIPATMQRQYFKTQRCDLTMTPEAFVKLYMGTIGFPKGSPLVEEMDKVVLPIVEAGLVDLWIRQAFRVGYRCFTPPDAMAKPELRPLALGDFFGVLLLFAGGAGLAGLVLIGEIFLGSRRRH
ncbi:putative glutamate receptor isoform X1 [Oratosquilla oratoria]